MATITNLRAKLRRLEKQERDIQKQVHEIYMQINDLEDERAVARITKSIKAGEVRIINEGITNYHCDPLRMYEVLSVNANKRHCKIKCRIYSLSYSDGDYMSRIIIDNDTSAKQLLSAKKIKAKDLAELKEIFVNPESYERSKWDLTDYGD